MSEHTPTPWRLCTTGNIGSAIEAQTGRKNHEWDDGYRIIATYQEGCKSERYTDQEANRRANGEFIVKAVNSHDALVKALEQIAEGTRDETYPLRAMGREQMREVASNALALLKASRLLPDFSAVEATAVSR